MCRNVRQRCPSLGGAHLLDVSLDRALCNADPKLEEFPPDAFGTPGAILDSHAADASVSAAGGPLKPTLVPNWYFSPLSCL